MEELLLKSQTKINRVSLEYKRYLHAKINRNSQMIGIKGARGTGKTTLLLQLGKEKKRLMKFFTLH